MVADTGDLTRDFAVFCRTLLEDAASRTGKSALAFRAGMVTFRLCEELPVELPWAEAQFPRVEAKSDDPAIYLLYGGLEDSPMVRMMGRLGYANVQTLLAETGCSGFYHHDEGHFELYDPARREGVRILRAPDAFPAWEPTSPLANFVAWMNEQAGGIMVHAATLAVSNGRGALICGRGGSGKSLLTLAGILSGLESAGDGYVIVAGLDGHFGAWSCSNTAKQTPAGLSLLGAAGERFRTGPINWQGKHVFAVPEVARDLPLPIDMVILPQIANRTAMSEARRGELFRALTETTILQLASDRAKVTSICAGIVRACPSFQFEMGPDIHQNARYLRTFLEGRSAA